MILACGIIIGCTGCRKIVQSAGGMAPTIQSGNNVTVDTLSYKFRKPRRWEIVMLRPPGFASNVFVIKRVIAIPYEMVSLTTNGIFVNGTNVDIPMAHVNFKYLLTSPDLSHAFIPVVSYPYAVPAEQYFVLGDNWSNSLDSRNYGAVPLTNIIGRVLLR
jgi:signal peptidase I